MEQNGNVWNTLETTVSYKAWARLTPTLIHDVTYELVTSGAEDDAMSRSMPPTPLHSIYVSPNMCYLILKAPRIYLCDMTARVVVDSSATQIPAMGINRMIITQRPVLSTY